MCLSSSSPVPLTLGAVVSSRARREKVTVKVIGFDLSHPNDSSPATFKEPLILFLLAPLLGVHQPESSESCSISKVDKIKILIV